jgi:hypothetical protein
MFGGVGLASADTDAGSPSALTDGPPSKLGSDPGPGTGNGRTPADEAVTGPTLSDDVDDSMADLLDLEKNDVLREAMLVQLLAAQQKGQIAQDVSSNLQQVIQADRAAQEARRAAETAQDGPTAQDDSP